MSVTVNVEGDPDVRVEEQVVEAVPPDVVEFTVEGTVSVSGNLLGEFAGRRLRPVAVDVSADGSTVTVELGGDTALHLDAVDVGVEIPEVEDLPGGRDDVGPPTDVIEGARDVDGPTDAGGAPDVDLGVVAFTVTGTISGIAPETFDAIDAGPESIDSVTFAVEEPRATDGGSDDVLLEFGVLGYRVAIRQDGTITIGTA